MKDNAYAALAGANTNIEAVISVRISESSSAAYQVGRHGVRYPSLLCQLHGFDVGHPIFPT